MRKPSIFLPLIATFLVAACDSPAPATPAGSGSNDTAGGALGDANPTADAGPLADAAKPDASADLATAADANAAADADAAKDAPASPDLPASPVDTGAAQDAGQPADVPAGPDAATPGCKAGEFKPLQSDTCQEATCTHLKQSAQDFVQSSAKKAAETPACKLDAECVTASQDTACSGNCPAVVNAASKAEFAKAIDTVDAFCKQHGVAAKCGFSTPTCLAPTPACVAGKCVYTKPAATKCGDPQPANTVCEGTLWVCKAGYFKGYGGGECHEATCENLAKAKSEAIDAAIAKAQVCKVGADDECIHIATSTACSGTCGAAVNAGMQNDVLKIVGWVDENLCKAFGYAAKCGFSTPKCMAPKPGCAAGKCEYSGVAP